MSKATKVKPQKVLDKLGKKSDQLYSQTSLFPNIDPYAKNVIGITQVVKEVLGTLREINPKDISDKTDKIKSGSSSAIFKQGKKSIKVNAPAGEDLERFKLNLLTDQTGAVLQDLARLFAQAYKSKSNKFTVKTKDLLKETKAFTGTRPNQQTLITFSERLFLLNLILIKITPPTFSGRKVKSNELFESFQRVVAINPLWALKKDGTKSYIKEFECSILPEVHDRETLRGIVVPTGFFELEPGKEQPRILLAWYICLRLSQLNESTSKGTPIRMDRKLLVNVMGLQKTESVNRREASKIIEKALDRLIELEIAANWVCNSKHKSKTRIPTDDKAVVYITPPQEVSDALYKPTKKHSKFIKQLKKLRSEQGISKVLEILDCNEETAEMLITETLMPETIMIRKMEAYYA